MKMVHFVSSLLSATVLFAALLLTPPLAFGADSVQLAVEGMTCGSCARTIREALLTQEGVEKVDVDLAAGTVTVTRRTSEHPTTTEVAAVIERAGYHVQPPSDSAARGTEPKE
jgi:copper chaperone